MDKAVHLCTSLQSTVFGNIVECGHASSMSTLNVSALLEIASRAISSRTWFFCTHASSSPTYRL